MIATMLSPTATSEMMNYRRRRLTTSIRCQLGISSAVAPMKRGIVEPAEAGEQAEHRARRGDGGEQRDDGADQQHQREALHLARSRPRTGPAP